MNKLIIIVSLGLSMGGCATMSKTECLGADDYSRWTVLGQKDGLSGIAPQIDKRGQACAKHNITIDREAYKVGYKKGLMAFCKPQNIFNLSLQDKGMGQGSWLLSNGGSLMNCPLEMQDELSTFYNVGNNYYQAKTRLNELQSGIASARSGLEKSDLKQENIDMLRGRIAENSELLPAAEENFENAKRILIQFKQQNGLN